MEGAAFIDSLINNDKQITLFINSLHSVASDQFWQFCSDKIAWIPLYAIAVLFMFRKVGWKRSIVYLVAITIGFLICDQLSGVVKDYVTRLRPNYTSETVRDGLIVLEERGGLYGFFSAHAANAFCTAVCYCKSMKPALEKKQYWILCFFAYLWASMVAISRVFVGKHFFGDVLAGTLVGLLIGLPVAKLATLFCRHFLEEHHGLTVGKIQKNTV